MADKSERLMNLVIALMVSRRFLTKRRIRHIVTGYHGQSDEAFDRMFERDKHELRELGIRLETGTFDPFGGEEGYRILRDDLELPSLDLTIDEAALLNVAAQVWDHLGLARESTSAVAKLKAAGVDADTEGFAITEPTIAARDRSFDDIWDAVTRCRPIRFEYRRPRARATTRNLQPWALLSWYGSWYVIGHDSDRDDTRVFRLGRITGPVETTGGPGQYRIPADLDVHALATHIFARSPSKHATIRVREGAAVALRRSAVECEPAGNGMDRLTLGYWDPDQLAGEIAAYADDAVVEGPDEVLEPVLDRLRAGADADDIT